MPSMTVVNAALNLVRDTILGVSSLPPLAITYVAIGTGTQGTPATATQLATEVFRKPLTNALAGASVGEGLFNGYIAPTDSVGTAISEVGFFGGNATGAANSGTLFFYGLYSHTHTATESLQMQADSTGA
jgi:hypothetical protein